MIQFAVNRITQLDLKRPCKKRFLEIKVVGVIWRNNLRKIVRAQFAAKRCSFFKLLIQLRLKKMAVVMLIIAIDGTKVVMARCIGLDLDNWASMVNSKVDHVMGPDFASLG